MKWQLWIPFLAWNFPHSKQVGVLDQACMSWKACILQLHHRIVLITNFTAGIQGIMDPDTSRAAIGRDLPLRLSGRVLATPCPERGWVWARDMEKEGLPRQKMSLPCPHLYCPAFLGWGTGYNHQASLQGLMDICYQFFHLLLLMITDQLVIIK